MAGPAAVEVVRRDDPGACRAWPGQFSVIAEEFERAVRAQIGDGGRSGLSLAQLCAACAEVTSLRASIVLVTEGNPQAAMAASDGPQHWRTCSSPWARGRGSTPWPRARCWWRICPGRRLAGCTLCPRRAHWGWERCSRFRCRWAPSGPGCCRCTPWRGPPGRWAARGLAAPGRSGDRGRCWRCSRRDAGSWPSLADAGGTSGGGAPGHRDGAGSWVLDEGRLREGAGQGVRRRRRAGRASATGGGAPRYGWSMTEPS